MPDRQKINWFLSRSRMSSKFSIFRQLESVVAINVNKNLTVEYQTTLMSEVVPQFIHLL